MMTPRIASQISPLPSGGEGVGEGEFALREPLRLSIDEPPALCYPQEIKLFQKS